MICGRCWFRRVARGGQIRRTGAVVVVVVVHKEDGWNGWLGCETIGRVSGRARMFGVLGIGCCSLGKHGMDGGVCLEMDGKDKPRDLVFSPLVSSTVPTLHRKAMPCHAMPETDAMRLITHVSGNGDDQEQQHHLTAEWRIRDT